MADTFSSNFDVKLLKCRTHFIAGTNGSSFRLSPNEDDFKVTGIGLMTDAGVMLTGITGFMLIDINDGVIHEVTLVSFDVKFNDVAKRSLLLLS